MYNLGDGVDQDYEAALKWFVAAATKITLMLNTVLGIYTTTLEVSDKTISGL